MKQFLKKVLYFKRLASYRIILHHTEIEWKCVLCILPSQVVNRRNNLTF